jgi:hypothetical protein
MKSEALLIGRIFDDRGNRMSPSHARKGGATRTSLSIAGLKATLRSKSQLGTRERRRAHASESRSRGAKT